MKRLVVGLLAHVDSGKTTLAEGLLYRAGVLRKLGRVDHRDAFLDTDSQERARGITIFAKQAVLTLPAADGADETELTLLDTPGHVDFSAEAERALQVLDYAVLVVSGTDGVQAHTETLWKLLARYRVPTFVFVNKMDLPGADAAVRLRELRGRFGDGCVDFSAAPDPEALALCSEPLMNEVLENGAASPETVVTAIARRQVFPVFFGAALRLDGLDGLLRGLQTLTRTPPRWPEFGARVFKISEDAGTRLTWLKVTGGVLHVKDVLPGGEKADALRLYNGGKFRLVSEALPGMVVAAAGPVSMRPGQGLGAESDAETPLLEPVLNYRVDCDADPHTLLKALQTLEGEDPQLHVNWRDDLGEVHVQLMGEVQLEILQTILQERFGLTVAFSEGGILYKETLTRAVEGIGHYEPLRHYAEVHLLLEPGARGSGVQLAADCPPDTLAENWQRLILTHLAERTHPGVLIGAPLTDVKITLAAGRAHQKHTEGGDFRQATYRAVRQGLRMAEAKDGVQLLEPWYDFTLELPADALGRAMADVQRMCGSFEAPETSGGTVRLTGRLPVATARGYAREVAAYTHGLGRWAVLPAGYDACHNAERHTVGCGVKACGNLQRCRALRDIRRGTGKLRRLNCFENIALCLTERFAKLLCTKNGQLVEMAYQNVSPVEHHLRAFGKRHLAPCRECLIGSINCFQQLVLRAAGNFRNQFARGRVRNRQPFFGFGVFPLSVYTIFFSFNHTKRLSLHVLWTFKICHSCTYRRPSSARISRSSARSASVMCSFKGARMSPP